MQTISKSFKIIFPAILLLLGSIQSVTADGDARHATQSEKNFHQSVSSVFSNAVPPCPAGWEKTGDTTQIEALDFVSTGAEEYPLHVDYCFACQNTQRIFEGQEKMVAEIQKLAESKAAFTEEMVRDLDERTTPHDVQTKILINANVTSRGIYENSFDPVTSIAGGKTYVCAEKKDTNRGWQEQVTYVFLGKGWELNRDCGVYMNAAVSKSLPHTAVQTIIVRIQAAPERTKQIVREIDWEALKKVMDPSSL